MSDAPQHQMQLLDPRECQFERTRGGLLALETGSGEGAVKHARVDVYRSFPLSDARSWISVRDADGNELGLIEDLELFSRQQAELIEAELQRRYFSPVIERVVSLKEEFGYSYWEVRTDAGSRRFTVQNGKGNIQLVGEHRMLIVDVDGNRFDLVDYRSLDTPHLRVLEVIY